MRITGYLPALMLAALLGAQVLQFAHIHADHGVPHDCIQCQSDSGQALLPETAHAPMFVAPAGNDRPVIALAPISNFYHLDARGPPRISC